MDKRDAVTPPDSPVAQQTAGAPADSAARRDRPRATGWRRLFGPGGRVVLIGIVAVAATAAALIALGSLSGRSGTTAPPKPTAKPFSLPALGHSGQRVSLRAYAGKPVILNFFASWCAPCQKETPLIAHFYRNTHGRVTVIGIDENDPTTAALKFVHREEVGYPVGVDAALMPTASAYGIRGLPQTFFLDAQHHIVKRVAGPVTQHDLQAGMALIDPRTK